MEKKMYCEICNCSEDETVKMYSNKSKFGITLCNKHYCQLTQQGNITDKSRSRRHEPRICDICGDTNKVGQYTKDGEFNGFLLCNKHKMQVVQYGKILERTKFDKNEIINYENHAEIVLYNRYHQETNRTTVDLKDIEEIKKYKWYIAGNGYVITDNYEGERIYLHRLLLGNPNDIVDHIDRNKLNNRRYNLRVTNYSNNTANRGVIKTNRSGITGVYFNKRKNKWHARIGSNNRNINLGLYSSFNDAVKARLRAELKYYPDYPPQRHLFSQYGIEGYDANAG